MADRDIARATMMVEGELVDIFMADFPIIEDLVVQMVEEAVNTIMLGARLNEASPIGRDIKDSIIKSNVVGG